MRSLVYSLLCLAAVVGVAGYGLSRGGGAPASSARSVLDGVAALDRPVTFTEPKIPLGELVQQVADQTGAPLSAAREVADEPVAVAVKAISARELLVQTADLFGFRWTRCGASDGMRYEIGEALDRRRREEALREAAFGEVVGRLRIQVERHLEVASLTAEELHLLTELDHPRRAQAEEPFSAASSPNAIADEERNERVPIARRLARSPVAHRLAKFLGELSPRQWEQILLGEAPLVFSTHPAPGEVALSPRTSQGLRASRPVMLAPGQRLMADNPEIGESIRRREQSLQEAWADASGYRVVVRSNARQVQAGANLLALTLSVSPVEGLGPDWSPDAAGGWGTSLRIEATRPSAGSGASASGAGAPHETAPDPIFTSPRRLVRGTQVAGLAARPTRSSVRRLHDLLPLLAAAYEIGFISDAYDASSRLPEHAGAEQEPVALGTLLIRYARPTHDWDRRGNLIRLRSHTWFFDRAREVPRRLIRRWRGLCDRHGALPIEEWSSGVAGLNPGQLERLPEVAEEAGLPPDFVAVSAVRPLLSLYTSLSSTERQALQRGEALPVATMSTQQRQLFQSAVRGAGDSATPAPSGGSSGASFALIQTPAVRVRETVGGAVQYRLETGMPAATSRSASQRRYSVRQITLQCRFGTGAVRSVTFIAATPQS